MTEPHEPKDSDAFLVAQEDDFDSVGHVGALRYFTCTNNSAKNINSQVMRK